MEPGTTPSLSVVKAERPAGMVPTGLSGYYAT